MRCRLWLILRAGKISLLFKWWSDWEETRDTYFCSRYVFFDQWFGGLFDGVEEEGEWRGALSEGEQSLEEE